MIDEHVEEEQFGACTAQTSRNVCVKSAASVAAHITRDERLELLSCVCVYALCIGIVYVLYIYGLRPIRNGGNIGNYCQCIFRYQSQAIAWARLMELFLWFSWRFMGALTAFNYTYLPQFDTNINNGKLAYQQLWATLSFYGIQKARVCVCVFVCIL